VGFLTSTSRARVFLAPVSVSPPTIPRNRFWGADVRLEQAFQKARRVWREALRGHVLAPPDASLSARLAALAAAAAQRRLGV
jgi:hypothetical protein